MNHIRNVPIVNLGLTGLALTVLALGFALGVVVAVGMLLVLQVLFNNNCNIIKGSLLLKLVVLWMRFCAKLSRSSE